MSIAKISFLFKFHDENGVEKNVEVPIESTKEIEKKIKMCNNCVEEISTSTQIQSFYSLITQIDSIPEENFEFLLKCIVLGYDIRTLEKYYATMYCHTQVALLKMDAMGIDITSFIDGHYSNTGLIRLNLESIIKMEYRGDHRYYEYVSNHDLSEDVVADILHSLYFGLEIEDINDYIEFHKKSKMIYDYTHVKLYKLLIEMSGEYYSLESNSSSLDRAISMLIQKNRFGICKYILKKSDDDKPIIEQSSACRFLMFYIDYPEYEEILLRYLEKYKNNSNVLRYMLTIILKCIDPEIIANMKTEVEIDSYIEKYMDIYRLL